jgi:hypothetical protein
MLQSGESKSFTCTLRALPDAQAVNAALDHIRTLRETGIPAEHCRLEDFAR